jgi:hypothetical protein
MPRTAAQLSRTTRAIAHKRMQQRGTERGTGPGAVLPSPKVDSLAPRVGLRRFAATVWLVGVLAAVPQSAAAADTAPAYGLNALAAEWLADGPVGVADLGRMGSNRIGLYRARFRQDAVLSGGTYSEWTRLDRLAKQASLNGVTLVPVLMNMPGETYTPPRTQEARNSFAAFAAAAARRYGPAGSFWPTCGCPTRPVRVWEVWNEQNMAPYWDPANPAEYAALLSNVKKQLRKADRTARVMMGGLAYASSYNTTTRLEPNAYLRSVIEQAGRNSFDALALHSYHSNATTGVSNAVAGTVATLGQYAGRDASGAPRHRVWLNEFGKATALDNPATPDVNESVQSESTQRTWMDTFLGALLPKRTAWNLGPVFWYAVRDSHQPTEAWLRLGLRRTAADGSDAGPKLAWDSYTSRSRTAPELNLPALR